jgi:exonuclease III
VTEVWSTFGARLRQDHGVEELLITDSIEGTREPTTRMGNPGRFETQGEPDMCIWDPRGATRRHMHQTLRRILGPPLYEKGIGKVTRVIKRTGNLDHQKVRFDVWIRNRNRKKGCTQTILRRLGRTSRISGLYARKHRPWDERNKRVESKGHDSDRKGPRVDKNLSCQKDLRFPNGESKARKPTTIRIATWNIQGLRGKRQEVSWFLQAQGVDIMAIQETGLTSDAWRLRIPGYNCLSIPCKGTGQRGLTLCIKEQWNGMEMMQKVILQGKPWILGTVYIPSIRELRRTALKDLIDRVRSIQRKEPSTPMVLMGDWNMKKLRVEKCLGLIKGKGTLMKPLDMNGSPKTWHGYQRNREWSSIDHIVVNDSARKWIGKPRVDRRWSCSDHWPVVGSIRLKDTSPLDNEEGWTYPKPRQVIRYNLDKVKELRYDIPCHNHWKALETLDEVDLDESLEKFIQTSENVAKDLKVIVTEPENDKTRPQSRPRLRCLSRTTKTLIKERGKALKTWQKGGQGSDLERYQGLKKEAKKAIRLDQERLWMNHLAKGAQALKVKKVKEVWRWIEGVSGHKGHSDIGGKSKTLVPIRGQDGVMRMKPKEILQVWTDHYKALASEGDGHSKDSEWWRNKDKVNHHSIKVTDLVVEREKLKALDQPMTWSEVLGALRKVKSGKAPGDDCIIPEWYKALIQVDNDPIRPRTPMGIELLKVLTRIWDSSYIPRKWRSALVVSIPKKGDLTSLENYRGISLINIGLKVLSMVVIERIVKVLIDELGLLSNNQAGFRKREECMGHVIALHEMLQRRSEKGWDTWLCFIDFRKAYDTVPHEAFLHKLLRYGVDSEGKCYKFIRAMYDTSYMSIRIGVTDLVTEQIPIRRGLRQGCPMSPILFDLFIDDILEGTLQDGVNVPGVKSGESQCSGLLFADDLVLLAPNKESLMRNMRKVEEWAQLWEMSFGISKCGVMIIRGIDKVQGLGEKGTDNGKVDKTGNVQGQLVQGVDTYHYNGEVDRTGNLQGQLVQGVDTYHYLGCLIDSKSRNLTERLREGVKERLEKGKRILAMGTPFLKSKSIPVLFKIYYVKSVLVPVLTYGGELYGMSTERTQPLQVIVDRALRWINGMKGEGSGGISIATLRREFGVTPIAARTSAMRVRAFVKYPELKTWISKLLTHERPNGVGTQTWTTMTRRWLTRNIPDWRDHHQLDNPLPLEKRVLKKTWDEMELKSTRETKSFREYQVRFRYNDEEGRTKMDYIRIASCYPKVQAGLMTVTQMRTGAFWTVERLVRINMIDSNPWKYQCPLCHHKVKSEDDTGWTTETGTHLILECSRWNKQREQWIKPLIDQVHQSLTLTLTLTEKGKTPKSWEVPTGRNGEPVGPLASDIYYSLLGEKWLGYVADTPKLSSSLSTSPQNTVRKREGLWEAIPGVILLTHYVQSIKVDRLRCLKRLIDSKKGKGKPNSDLISMNRGLANENMVVGISTSLSLKRYGVTELTAERPNKSLKGIIIPELGGGS